MNDLSQQSVRNVFFEALRQELEAAKNSRVCRKFSDLQHLTSGVGRCLEPVQSGRDWIQRLRHESSLEIRVSSFFESLSSGRRLKLLQEVNEGVRTRVDSSVPAPDDCFAGQEELDDFAVYAADGHYHACSVHEEKIGGKRRPVGHFFAINLRSMSARHLDLARPAPGRKREHDIAALKRLQGEVLRMGEPKGRKVILIYDRAILDFLQWEKWKRGKGLYTVSRLKENLKLICCGVNEFDRGDERNNGVLGDRMMGTSAGVLIRQITYCDPATGTVYEYLTNEMTLPPGLIAFMYMKRWTIEKLFDQFKNKLLERKAWAKTAEAKCQQALFLCLTHNLMLLMERKIEAEEQITDAKITKKRRERIRKMREAAEAARRPVNPMLLRLSRSIERSLQFLRWLRFVLNRSSSWNYAMRQLRPLMERYL